MQQLLRGLGSTSVLSGMCCTLCFCCLCQGISYDVCVPPRCRRVCGDWGHNTGHAEDESRQGVKRPQHCVGGGRGQHGPVSTWCQPRNLVGWGL